MDVGWDNNTRTVELITNNTPEYYDLYLPDKECYEMFSKMNYEGEMPRKLSKLFKIFYTGTRYELYPSGMTVDKYLDNIVFPGYDYLGLNTVETGEEFLFGNNCFFMDVDKRLVTAHQCN